MELLEDGSKKLLSKPLLEGENEKPKSRRRKFCNFFLQPSILGKDLLTMEKFGLVQYMATAAVAYVFVFLAKPYHFMSNSGYGKVTTETTKAEVKKEGDKEKPTVLEKKETRVETPGTSVKESIQDIVVEGGQHEIKDVVLTINQAIEPVGKGMTKIQETFHQTPVASEDDKEDNEVQVEKHVETSVAGTASTL